MTDSVPTNNILQTYRAFPPSDPDTNCDQGETGYSNVQGNIVNNILSNGVLGPDTICPVVLQLPKWTADSNDAYDQATCEDRYYGWTGTLGPQCELGATGCAPIYQLQSLQLVTKNLVNGSIHAVRPSLLQPGDVFSDYNQQSPLNENCENNCSYEAAFTCGFTGTSDVKNTVRPFIYDGLLAPVYNIGYASRCSLYNNIETIKYFISPYQNGTTTSNTVKGTQYFTIGNRKNPCTCVALLNFGNVFQATDTEINANLYWVNIKLYTKNKYGNVCIKRPVSLHIEHGPDNGMNNCFTPYFAHAREIPLESSCEEQECWTPTYQCGHQPTEQPVTNCLNMVFVSDCVDIAQLGLISDENCNYCTSVILIPKPNLLC
jgi:hypothetical protein